MTNKISEKTLIPISLVIALLGGSAFVTNLNYKTNANAEAFTSFKEKQEDRDDKIMKKLDALLIDVSILKIELKKGN